uniref:Uncharacterized protein n=1 Tax=Anguilla anguilla TaxID=7936 RepID=A0A0E9TJM3_ANGAN
MENALSRVWSVNPSREHQENKKRPERTPPYLR